MATAFRITGGNSLHGEVTIQGSKNTVFPLIAACLLTEEPCTIENVPAISDAATMLEIAERLGADVAWEREAHRVTIRAAHIDSTSIDEALARKFRGSILFSGALLGRIREATTPYPGGDVIGARPLRTHLHALQALGTRVEENERIHLDGRGLEGSDVTLEEPSVTATENTILAAVLAPGSTLIRLAACEPHVHELILFLQRMGARIRWTDGMRISVQGVDRLRGASYRLNPDELEVSSFATLAAATRSELTLADIDPEYLDAVFLQLRTMGVAYEVNDRTLVIRRPGGPYRSFRVQSGLYPKLGSDHLPPFAVLATQAEGTSLIHDWLYENRLRYVPELQKMGAECRILDPHRAEISGPTALRGATIEGLDIRSGMTLIIAALTAAGRTVISGVEHLDRGYENLEQRLQAVGADIQRVKEA